MEDQVTLRQLTQGARRTPAETPVPSEVQPAANLEILRANKGWLLAVAIVGIIVITMLFVPNYPSYAPQSTPSKALPTGLLPDAPAANRDEFGGIAVGEDRLGSTSDKPATSPPENTPPLSPGSSITRGSRMYRIPVRISTELDTAKQQIDIEKAKANALDTQLATAKQGIEAEASQAAELQSRLETLANQIEVDRIYLDQTSQADVDAFNANVNLYNTLLRSARAENITANKLIAAYKTLLEEAKAQDREVNQLVDNYNAKLQQYGR